MILKYFCPINNFSDYFVRGAYFKSDEQILDDVNVIRKAKIPGVIIQGRYDICCSPDTAWQLHKVRIWFLLFSNLFKLLIVAFLNGHLMTRSLEKFLLQRWPEADYIWIPDAGHCEYEPGIQHELLNATDKYRNI